MEPQRAAWRMRLLFSLLEVDLHAGARGRAEADPRQWGLLPASSIIFSTRKRQEMETVPRVTPASQMAGRDKQDAALSTKPTFGGQDFYERQKFI